MNKPAQTLPSAVTMKWLMEGAINPLAGHSLARMSIAPGHTSERHLHSNCTETIHVLSGEISQLCEETWTMMRAGQTCLIPINHLHQTRNISDDMAVLMLAYSSGSRVYVSK